MEPTKEQLLQWYVVEKKSYRQIMKLIGTKSNHKIPKLLNKHGIEIRRGSEAVKTQWINNDERRKQQGEVFKEAHSGNPSPKRVDIKQRKKEFLEYDLEVVAIEYNGGYANIKCKCMKCGEISWKNRSNKNGCVYCGHKKRGENSRIPDGDIEKLAEQANINLVEVIRTTHLRVKYTCDKHLQDGVQELPYSSLKDRPECKLCRKEKIKAAFKGRKQTSDRFTESHRISRWRRRVFERDSYTCQKCFDNTGGNLNAHHIENFSSHKTIRYDIDNGVTLCETCHNPKHEGSFHNIYGTFNNNREQLNEFLQLNNKQLTIFK